MGINKIIFKILIYSNKSLQATDNHLTHLSMHQSDY